MSKIVIPQMFNLPIYINDKAHKRVIFPSSSLNLQINFLHTPIQSCMHVKMLQCLLKPSNMTLIPRFVNCRSLVFLSGRRPP